MYIPKKNCNILPNYLAKNLSTELKTEHPIIGNEDFTVSRAPL